jgi:hypothetical protein
MLSRGHHTAIFIISMFMLLLLKDLLTKLIVTCTLKDKLTTWLCLVEGYLASLHDLVSFKIEHTICSRVRCITKENTIDRPRLKLIQLLPFLKDKALATKDMEVTHLRCATVHQLVTGFLLVYSEVDPVRNLARGIHRLNPEPSRSPMLIKHRPSHLTQGSIFLSTTPFRGGVYGLENWCSRPKSWQKVSKQEFLNSEPLSLRIAWHLRASHSSTSRQDHEKNQTSPHSPQDRTPTHMRVVVHHNEDVPLPTHRSHTSWANKVHMEQLTWMLSHHIGERWLRRGYHLGMPTRSTNQLFLKPQP